MCVSVTFWGFVRSFEDEMGGFEKSSKTTHTSLPVPSKQRPEHGLLPKFLLPKLLRPILPTPIYDTRLVVGGAHLGTDARVMTYDSSTLTFHRRSVYSSLLF